jgi:hypothetical protein
MLDLAAAIANHMEHFHGTELVDYHEWNLDGTEETSYSVRALKRATRRVAVTVGDGVQVFVEMAPWHLQANMMSRPPKKGDRFESAAWGTWAVEEADIHTLATRYRCECKKVA